MAIYLSTYRTHGNFYCMKVSLYSKEMNFSQLYFVDHQFQSFMVYMHYCSNCKRLYALLCIIPHCGLGARGTRLSTKVISPRVSACKNWH